MRATVIHLFPIHLFCKPIETMKKSTPNHIILGRPHPLIVHSMRSLLSELGFQPTAFDQAETTPPSDVAGIVVSTSVSNDPQFAFERIVDQLTQKFPGAPMVVATIMTREFATRMVENAFLKIGRPVRVRPLGDSKHVRPSMTANEVLLVHREELEQPASRAHFAGMLRSWRENGAIQLEKRILTLASSTRSNDATAPWQRRSA